MPVPILATKLYAPAQRSGTVRRRRLDDRLDTALDRKLTLVSAPAGFGKTTVVADWARAGDLRVAWLSLDEGDSDLLRFLTYLVAALRGLVPEVGEGVLPMLRMPQPPAAESVVTALVNDLVGAGSDLVLVLDDYHSIDSRPVDEVVALLIERLPPRLHLIIASREDPPLPLARLRARGELTELRVGDLRFTAEESRRFLNDVRGLRLSGEDVALLEASTEGWIAGLQLAALSLEGEPDPTPLIRAFSGSHRFVLDYLVEEVLGRQPPDVLRFLLLTSVLEQLSGPLCDAVTHGGTPGQETLELLERSNLFLVPLDGDRQWYRYHHLFRQLLRQRLGREETPARLDELNVRASRWYEDNGHDLEAFRHAAEGNDIARAIRLVRGHGLPLYARGALAPIVAWLSSLPPRTMQEWPELRVLQATVLLGSGQTIGILELLDAAETDLAARHSPAGPELVGQIAAVRAMLALSQHRAEVMIAESRRALEHLPPHDLPGRGTMIWTQGYAHEVLGDRAAARTAYSEALRMSRAAGNRFGEMVALTGLAGIHELDTELLLAATTYQETIRLAADLPYPAVAEAHLGLARISYETNDLHSAWQLGRRALELAGQLQHTDRPAACQVLLARIKLAQGHPQDAGERLEQARTWVRQLDDARELPNVMTALARLKLLRGEIETASHLAEEFDLPVIHARALLAQGQATQALEVLQPLRSRAEARGWHDERLSLLLLEAIAAAAAGSPSQARALLDEAMNTAIPQRYLRSFLDEGTAMARLLRHVSGHHHTNALRLLTAFPPAGRSTHPPRDGLPEPLSAREREVLTLIADGLSTQAIAERLYLSPLTVKVHLRNIYTKLGARRRTEAVAIGHGLGLIERTR